MGAAERALKPVRTLAGALAGVKAAESLTAGMVMQRSPLYDQVFTATLELPYYLCASCLWEAEVSLTQLQRAWGLMVSRMQGAQAWSKATVPFFRRCGWRSVELTGLCDRRARSSLTRARISLCWLWRLGTSATCWRLEPSGGRCDVPSSTSQATTERFSGIALFARARRAPAPWEETQQSRGLFSAC
eukprot:6483214-Pyramimonas_sp.AAC.1